MLGVTPSQVGESPEFKRRARALFHQVVPELVKEMEKLRLGRAVQHLHGFEFREDGGLGFAWYDRSNDAIAIYPMVMDEETRIDLEVFKVFGRRLWKVLSSVDKLRWIRLEVNPPIQIVNRVADWFKQNPSTMHSKAVTGMETVVADTFKVVFADCCLDPNALDLKAYPPAQSLMKGEGRVCLKPVIGKFTRDDKQLEFENAFAEYCANSGRIKLSDNSVEEAVNNLFRSIAC